MRIRSKNIDLETITLIVNIIDGWQGKLTWESLISEIEQRLKVKYTRQTLDKHARIKLAYQSYKTSHENLPAVENITDPNTKLLMDKISKLEVEKSRLQLENERLLEQFVRWGYNAHLKGLDYDYLNNPLPSVNREPTKFKQPLN